MAVYYFMFGFVVSSTDIFDFNRTSFAILVWSFQSSFIDCRCVMSEWRMLMVCRSAGTLNLKTCSFVCITVRLAHLSDCVQLNPVTPTLLPGCRRRHDDAPSSHSGPCRVFVQRGFLPVGNTPGCYCAWHSLKYVCEKDEGHQRLNGHKDQHCSFTQKNKEEGGNRDVQKARGEWRSRLRLQRSLPTLSRDLGRSCACVCVCSRKREGRASIVSFPVYTLVCLFSAVVIWQPVCRAGEVTVMNWLH